MSERETSFSIGMVHDEMIHAQTTRCLISTRSSFDELDEIIMVMGSVGSFDYGRNRVVSYFLDNTSSEWLLTVDADMVWKPEHVQMVFASAHPKERPVVSGLYYINNRPPVPCVVGRTPDGYLRNLRGWEDDGMLECNGVGGGFMLIHRGVLEEMERVFDANRDDHAGVWYRQSAVSAVQTILEPDHAFCQRVEQLGYPVVVQTECLVGHIKPRVLPWYERGMEE